ncbi:MAG: right-handed parallel beta-helix repeat-containing protein [Ruminococcaceae bacterium]|nr:right-handed parallel beta-helix repeat-containing protein [Oscillospiraceae bacterium]
MNTLDFDFRLSSKKDISDATAEIEKRLAEFGVCELGPGKFYVSGIKMPNGSSIFGMGAATKLILLPQIQSGAAITLGSFCTVKNLEIRGCEEKKELPSEVGERHGILFEGSASETKDFESQNKHSIISDCFITAFSGGGITLRNTGYSPRSSITASNCHIWNSGAGIYIPYFSEYHEFTNMLCTENLYGCINNGGNNVFTGCGFTSNKTGFVIDNSNGKANNQAHGCAVGCTFNHSDDNKGVGIAVYGAKWGYVFSACQLHYSKVIVENSTNITFDSFTVGKKSSFEFKGGNLSMLTNCAFLFEPDIKAEDNDKIKITNCFTADGEEILL